MTRQLTTKEQDPQAQLQSHTPTQPTRSKLRHPFISFFLHLVSLTLNIPFKFTLLTFATPTLTSGATSTCTPTPFPQAPLNPQFLGNLTSSSPSKRLSFTTGHLASSRTSVVTLHAFLSGSIPRSHFATVAAYTCVPRASILSTIFWY